MKSLLTLVAWTVASVTIVYAATNPDHGVVYESPLATFGLGLAGLAMCVHAYRRDAAEA